MSGATPPLESIGHTSGAAENKSHRSGYTKPNFLCCCFCFPGSLARTLLGSTALIGVAEVIVVVGEEDSEVDAVDEDDCSGTAEIAETGGNAAADGCEIRSCGQLNDLALWMRAAWPPALRPRSACVSLLPPPMPTKADEAKSPRIPRTRRMSLCTRLDLE